MFRKKLLSLLLALTMLTTAALGAADPWSYEEELTESVRLTEGVFDNGNRQVEHYLTYTPGGCVTPYLVYGDKLLDMPGFRQAAAELQESGKRVIAGTNGDYFVMATGLPVGLVISDREIITSDDGNPALGFTADGHAFFGRPVIHMGFSAGGQYYRLRSINRPIRTGDFYLYTPEYGTKTPVSVNCRNLVVIPDEGAGLRIGESATVTVESNYRSAGAVEIPEGRWIICLTEDSDAWRQSGMDALQKGDRLTLDISSEDAAWSDCTYATGSLYKLITDGEIEADLDKIDKTLAPRTTVGIRPDGTVIVYTVDGRRPPYSTGLTLRETAQRLLELGCTEAGALDGGGSTVLYAQPAGEDDFAMRNLPSTGSEREATTYLVLASSGRGSGIPRTVTVRGGTAAIMAGSSIQLTAGVCDETGAPVSGGGIVWSADAGSIDPSGLYTAPDQDCTVRITASCSGVTGSYSMRIVQTPDSLQIRYSGSGEEVTVLEPAPGASVDLSAAAGWGLMEVRADDDRFVWETTGNAGAVDEEGRFTASAFGGEGSLILRAGGRSLTVGVHVKPVFLCAEDFETAVTGSSAGLSWSQERSMERVHNGKGSLRLDYDLSSGAAEYPMSFELADKADYLYLWVWCDGSGNRLYAVQGGESVFLDELTFTGWKQYALPVAGLGIGGLRLTGSGTGRIWLDQAVLTSAPEPDLDPPIIQLSASGSFISCYLSDMTDTLPAEENIRLTLDGKPLSFHYSTETGRVWTTVEESESLRRVTLTAADNSGNLNSASVMLAGETEVPFADVSGHWAEQYAAYLAAKNVIAGKPSGDGVIFDPDSPLTRAEFAVLLCRWLELDAGDAPAPDFLDAEDIPDWAQDSVRTVSALGLIQGEQGTDGLWFKPRASVTRAQAAAILGRTLEGGRPGADLVFRDADAIPDWAAAHVSVLAFMGVLRGFEDGSFRPSDTLTRAQAAKLMTELS